MDPTTRELGERGQERTSVVPYLAAFGLAGLVSRVALQWSAGAWVAGSCLATAAMVVWTSRQGRREAREALLGLHDWKGDEAVLDLGCDRGQLLLAAARRLTTGKVTGVSPWFSRDPAGDPRDRLLARAREAGVEDRVEVVRGDLRSLPFGDRTFDVVLSDLALHQMPDPEGRAAAVREIVRVLRPGGRAILQDQAYTWSYAATLRAAGALEVRRSPPRFWSFPPVRTVTGLGPSVRNSSASGPLC